MPYQSILVESLSAVGLITFNRPAAMNALNAELIAETGAALDKFEADSAIGCVVLTGSEKAFAAGADIKEMMGRHFTDAYLDEFLSPWDRVTKFRKPIIAAVAGYALGGGCEIALMCDFIVAADTAKFGQPEVKLGIPPGAGGTQRMTRLIGRAKAMDMCLTGRLMDAREAEMAGMVARIVPADKLREEALKIAATIAAQPRIAALMVKECVNRAEETTLAEGTRFERRMFQAAFASADQKEGMAAFAAKRQPFFTNK